MKKLLFLAALLFSSPAYAAIAHVASATTVNEFPGGPDIEVVLGSGAVGAEGAIGVCVGIEDTNVSDDVAISSSPSLTWVKVDTVAVTNSLDERVSMFYAVGVSASTSYTITATADADGVDYFPGIAASSFSGVDQVAPQDAEGESSSSDSGMNSSSVGITTATAGAMIMDCAALGGSGAGNMTATTGQTEVTGSTNEFYAGYELAGAAGAYTQTVTFTSPSAEDRVVHMALALKAAAGGGGGEAQRVLVS